MTMLRKDRLFFTWLIVLLVSTTIALVVFDSSADVNGSMSLAQGEPLSFSMTADDTSEVFTFGNRIELISFKFKPHLASTDSGYVTLEGSDDKSLWVNLRPSGTWSIAQADSGKGHGLNYPYARGTKFFRMIFNGNEADANNTIDVTINGGGW